MCIPWNLHLSDQHGGGLSLHGFWSGAQKFVFCHLFCTIVLWRRFKSNFISSIELRVLKPVLKNRLLLQWFRLRDFYFYPTKEEESGILSRKAGGLHIHRRVLIITSIRDITFCSVEPSSTRSVRKCWTGWYHYHAGNKQKYSGVEINQLLEISILQKHLFNRLLQPLWSAPALGGAAQRLRLQFTSVPHWKTSGERFKGSSTHHPSYIYQSASLWLPSTESGYNPEAVDCINDHELACRRLSAFAHIPFTIGEFTSTL